MAPPIYNERANTGTDPQERGRMLQPGTQVGRYEIQRRLGRGGMGTVYVAHDPVLGRMVAIKLFLSDLDMPDATQRFVREARSAAALNHANIVTVHDYGDFSSQPYIVMEYIQGETLAEIVKRKAPLSPADKLRWIEELCAGVAYAHQHAVIHRDIKPTNLMIDGSGRLKILDFGIAKMLGTLGTNATGLIGTPGYMAPEQILGGTIDPRCDLFSIGVVCYELFAYTEAFPGDTVPAITHRIVSEEPVALHRLVPDVHPDIVSIVEQAIKKSPADRFPDAESLRVAVSRVRRQLESDSGWEPTLIPSRPAAAPAAGVNQIGTGSSRKQVPHAISVAELTPPPDPRKTDREALQRRRAAQIAAALELARLRQSEGQLEQALDACQQALTLDETNAPALELEEHIRSALTKQRVGSLLTDARDELQKGALTSAQNLLEQARALDAQAHDAKRLERDLRLARVEQERLRQRTDAARKALAAAVQAFDRGDIETALAGARQAMELDAESVDACNLEAEALRRLYDEVSLPLAGDSAIGIPAATVIAPPKVKAAAATRPPVPATGATGRAPRIALRSLVALAGTRVRATPARHKLIAGAAVVAILLVGLAITVVVRRPVAAAPMGTLVIEAIPWASITAIEAEDGSSQPLPNPAATPVSLRLPAGRYTIRLSGPPPDAESRVVAVRVEPNGLTAAAIERFRALTPEEYFEPYLTPVAAAVETAPAAPAADAKPPGTVQ